MGRAIFKLSHIDLRLRWLEIELMPLVPIGERQSTRGELARYIKRADQLIIPSASRRALLVKLLADCFWRANVKEQDRDAFIVPFVTSVPNFDYNTYLESPTWKAIH